MSPLSEISVRQNQRIVIKYRNIYPRKLTGHFISDFTADFSFFAHPQVTRSPPGFSAGCGTPGSVCSFTVLSPARRVKILSSRCTWILSFFFSWSKCAGVCPLQPSAGHGAQEFVLTAPSAGRHYAICPQRLQLVAALQDLRDHGRVIRLLSRPNVRDLRDGLIQRCREEISRTPFRGMARLEGSTSSDPPRSALRAVESIVCGRHADQAQVEVLIVQCMAQAFFCIRAVFSKCLDRQHVVLLPGIMCVLFLYIFHFTPRPSNSGGIISQ